MFMKMYDEKRKKMQKPINQIKSNQIKSIEQSKNTRELMKRVGLEETMAEVVK